MSRAVISTEIKYVDNQYVVAVSVVNMAEATRAALESTGGVAVDVGGVFEAETVTVDDTASPAFTLASEIVRFPNDFVRVKRFDATNDATAWIKSKAWAVAVIARVTTAVDAAENAYVYAGKVIGVQHTNI